MKVFQNSPGAKTVLYSWTILLYAFIFVPIFVVIYASFDKNEIFRFPITEFSLKWYKEFFSSAGFIDSIVNSFVLGVTASIGAVILGALAAIVVTRFSFRGKNLFYLALISPMVLSKIVLGAAILSFLVQIGVPRSGTTLVALHVLLTLPFAFLVIWSRLSSMGVLYEEAASTLGANEIRSSFEVTIPLMAPAAMGAALLAATISFDEFPATQFLVTPSTETVPVQVYSMIQTTISPTVNVLATFLIVVTAILPLIAALAFGVARKGVIGDE